MRKRLFLALVSGAVVLSLAGTPAVALAHNGVDDSHDGDTTQTTTSTNSGTDSTRDKTERATTAKNRLNAAKLKVCQQREKRISTIITNSTKRTQNQLEVFTKIAVRVETFYQTKGKTVANYDELVAKVNTAQAKAEADLATLKTITTLDCEGDDPKGEVDTFRATLKQLQQDLKDYRTAVKDLIVGVRSAQGDDNEN